MWQSCQRYFIATHRFLSFFSHLITLSRIRNLGFQWKRNDAKNGRFFASRRTNFASVTHISFRNTRVWPQGSNLQTDSQQIGERGFCRHQLSRIFIRGGGDSPRGCRWEKVYTSAFWKSKKPFLPRFRRSSQCPQNLTSSTRPTQMQ